MRAQARIAQRSSRSFRRAARDSLRRADFPKGNSPVPARPPANRLTARSSHPQERTAIGARQGQLPGGTSNTPGPWQGRPIRRYETSTNPPMDWCHERNDRARIDAVPGRPPEAIDVAGCVRRLAIREGFDPACQALPTARVSFALAVAFSVVRRSRAVGAGAGADGGSADRWPSGPALLARAITKRATFAGERQTFSATFAARDRCGVEDR